MRPQILLLSVALALLPLACLGSLYSKGDDVVILTAASYDKAIVHADGVSMVEFYAPWCGHCKNLSPHYKTVAQKLKGIMTIGAVDCDDASNKKLCAGQGIKGYPTLKLFGPEKMKNPYTGEFYREPIDFHGAHTAKGLHDAATALLTNAHITRPSSLEEFVEFTSSKPDLPKVVLFTSKKETPVMFKGLSMQLHRGLDFAEVHESVEDVVTLHGIERFPSVLVIKADESTELYSGDLKAPQLRDFLITFSSAPPDTSSDSGSADKEPKEQQVKNMTLEEAIELDAKEDMWLLALHGTGGSDCKESVAAFKKAAAEMQQVVKAALVGVSTDQAEQVSRYGASPSSLRSEPCALQLVLLPLGQDKADFDEYALYQGALDGKALQKWVTDAMPNLPSEISSKTFEYFMAPGGAGGGDVDNGADDEAGSAPKLTIKVLLFTNKDEVPGVYKALTFNFRPVMFKLHGLAFGWVQSTTRDGQDLMKRFGVTKVPSLVLVSLTPAEGKEGYQAGMQPYQGPLNYNSMHKWLDSIVMALSSGPGGKGPGGGGSSEDAMARLVPEVTDDAGLRTLCADKGGICVLGLIDASAEKHGQVKKTLVKLAMDRDGQPFSFCWVDGAKFRSVSAAFNLIPTDLPAIVALSGKRMRYASLPKVSGSEGVVSFIDGVLGGSIRTTMLQELPLVVEASAASASDEAAVEEEAVEEEFDLSDIMSEEVEAGSSSKEQKMREVEEQLKAEEEASAAAAKKATKKKSKKSKKSKSKAAKTEL